MAYVTSPPRPPKSTKSTEVLKPRPTAPPAGRSSLRGARAPPADPSPVQDAARRRRIEGGSRHLTSPPPPLAGTDPRTRFPYAPDPPRPDPLPRVAVSGRRMDSSLCPARLLFWSVMKFLYAPMSVFAASPPHSRRLTSLLD